MIEQLPWLLKPPADFPVSCKAAASSESAGHDLKRLSQFSLDENQLLRLDRSVARARAAGNSLAPLCELRLGLLSNATLDFISPAVAATSLRYGLNVLATRADFGMVMQEAISLSSSLNVSRPHVVLFVLDYRWFPFETCPGQPDRAESVVQRCLAQLQALRQAVHSNSGAVCILQTLAPPEYSLFGNLDRALPGTLTWMIERFNALIGASLSDSEDLLLDVAGLAQLVGLAEWNDVTAWNLAKVPFSHKFLAIYADHVGRLLGALRGKSRRCLILDLDNTVWGGVIGDDGLEGIQIAQGDATGEAFLNVQRAALALRDRGIVLAVSSKNTEEIARRPFEEHPEMLLRLDHIAVFQANWNDKATNIKAIAETLSLGLDAMVFLDDNPMERDLVRRMLPEVAVPELPSDPALYAQILSFAGYFEATRFSTEDSSRASFYQDNGKRAQLKQQAGDLDTYLRSLDMKLTFQPFDDVGRARIAQLISKSNQFNLTTRRYSEADVASLQYEAGILTLQVRLEDIFGDNGMISVIVCRPLSAEVLEIDTWLMSCRVLGRRVEEAVLQEIQHFARKHGFQRILGRYIPTDRNGLVKEHYPKVGFLETEQLADGTTLWELEVRTTEPDLPMSIQHSVQVVSDEPTMVEASAL